MDPVSQAALGAVVGQAAGHRRLGYWAAAVGALAGALPDIDVLFSVGGDFFDQLVLHRGFTHSLLFAPLAGPLIGWLVWRVELARGLAPARSTGRLATWMLVASLALLSHPLLDVLTPYGTQLLAPLSDARFAINAMPIIDPLYTALLCLGLWLAARPLARHAHTTAVLTLLVSCSYLGFGWYLNHAAEREAIRQLAAAGITDARVAAFPTILQVHYRRVVARTPDADRVGYISMWQPCPIDWRAAPVHDGTEIAQFLATREGAIFHWFTMGWTRFVHAVDGDRLLLRAIDLRYGFTDDPDESIFNAYAPLLADTRALGPVRAGRDQPDAVEQRLAGLLQETYAPFCRLAA
ncbi:MAG: metal-dependent hydrolase [Pseudomonadales bacterium]|nr:metal-dependent hydrolase [Pseudomonadales bacterium]